jgi:uncharacterized protein (DUF169 family)
MPTSREINDALNLYIRPTTFPVGVLPLPAVSDGPPDLVKKAKSPAADMEQPVTVCMAIGMARRYGWTLLVKREDNVCPLGGIAMGFEQPRERFWDGSLFSEYTGRPQSAVARDAHDLKRFETGQYEALLIAPLHAGGFTPEVTIIYGNSAQVMRLTQAALFRRGGHLASLASGVLDCSDLIVQPLAADDCQVILPCNGDRVFGMAQDHEVAFTMPQSKAAEVLAGLGDTHKLGQRFPIPVYMKFRPEMPEAYKRLLSYVRTEAD